MKVSHCVELTVRDKQKIQNHCTVTVTYAHKALVVPFITHVLLVVSKIQALACFIITNTNSWIPTAVMKTVPKLSSAAVLQSEVTLRIYKMCDAVKNVVKIDDHTSASLTMVSLYLTAAQVYVCVGEIHVEVFAMSTSQSSKFFDVLIV